jgi:hypothetical protein
VLCTPEFRGVAFMGVFPETATVGAVLDGVPLAYEGEAPARQVLSQYRSCPAFGFHLPGETFHELGIEVPERVSLEFATTSTIYDVKKVSADEGL